MTLIVKKALTTAIVKYLVVGNYTNLFADILDTWANSLWMPYAESRVTNNLLGLKPGPYVPLNASYCTYYIATLELGSLLFLSP